MEKDKKEQKQTQKNINSRTKIISHFNNLFARLVMTLFIYPPSYLFIHFFYLKVSF